MRAIDRAAIDDWGIPGAVLMEAAGSAFARACIEELGGKTDGKRILLLCGPGNNGGDGFVAARHLAGTGAAVTVVLSCPPSALSGDAAAHFAPIVRAASGVRIIESADQLQEIVVQAKRYDLFGDCLLGTGSKGAPKGVVMALVKYLWNAAREFPGIPIVACDIPSGVDADTGKVADENLVVKAARTVTFALPKPGLLQLPGSDYAGRVTVADIGIPKAIIDTANLPFDVTTKHWLRNILPPRSETRDANKGSFGTVLIIAGSAGMAGASALSALSALRGGAGLVMLAIPESLLDTAAALAPEAILRPLPETSERSHGGPGALEAALALVEKADAVAIGPGMGGNTETISFVQAVVRKASKPMVIDADGLNAIVKSEAPIRFADGAPVVLTPHPGEMGRLLGTDVKTVQSDRQAAILDCAAKFNAVALLKGSRTLIGMPDGRMAFNRRGSVALATAGSGDVLTGLIAALLAQKLNGYEAARAGAFLHALAGEAIGRDNGNVGTLASDIRHRLPEARQTLYKNDAPLRASAEIVDDL